MRRTLLAVPILFMFLAGGLSHQDAKAAAGVALRWNNCFSDGGLSNRSFACNLNTQSELLIATFQMPNAASPVYGMQSHLLIATAGPVLPAWWAMFNVGSCRATSLTMNTIQPATSTTCQDMWSGQAASGIGIYTVGALGPATARISAVAALPSPSPASLVTGVEYYTYTIRIDHAKSVGVGSCAGCSTPACIMIEDITPMGVSTPVAILTTPSNGADSHFVTWQGGAGVPSLPNGGCSGAVPVRNQTWSGIKSLYR